MNIPSTIRFELMNGIAEKDVKGSKFVIYAHLCSKGIYIGMTEDPVKRWQQHISDSFNTGSQYYDDKFREAIRECGVGQFKHYILAIANYEEAAKKKEAVAISYYKANLNMKREPYNECRDYGYRILEGQIGKAVILEKKSREGTFVSRDDSFRETIIAEIYMEFGRKRLRCIKGQPFPAGLKIECSKEERERFNDGDKVRVNVARSEKQGKTYLVAAKTSRLILVK
jgi:hypothetical protein